MLRLSLTSEGPQFADNEFPPDKCDRIQKRINPESNEHFVNLNN